VLSQLIPPIKPIFFIYFPAFYAFIFSVFQMLVKEYALIHIQRY